MISEAHDIAVLESRAVRPGWRSRPGTFVDLERAEMAVRDLLVALGEDPDREGLADTPRRVARMYRELFRGVSADPAAHLAGSGNSDHLFSGNYGHIGGL